MSPSGYAQQPGFGGGAGGGGPLSPSVVGTWDAYFEPQGGGPVSDPSAVPMVPLVLDLLVLWRGAPGWFDDASLEAGAGGSDGVHRVSSRGIAVEVRFDRQTDTVSIQGQTIALQGANVLLIDEMSDARGVLIAGTLRIDRLVSGVRAGRGGPSVDPLSEMIRKSPALFAYLRCDPAFTDPSDPATTMRLRQCEQLR